MHIRSCFDLIMFWLWSPPWVCALRSCFDHLMCIKHTCIHTHDLMCQNDICKHIHEPTCIETLHISSSYIHIDLNIYIDIHTYVYVFMYRLVNVHICTHICMHICVHISWGSERLCTSAHVWVYIHVYIYVYLQIYVWIYVQIYLCVKRLYFAHQLIYRSLFTSAGHVSFHISVSYL